MRRRESGRVRIRDGSQFISTLLRKSGKGYTNVYPYVETKVRDLEDGDLRCKNGFFFKSEIK